jgi:hypothetical protein
MCAAIIARAVAVITTTAEQEEYYENEKQQAHFNFLSWFLMFNLAATEVAPWFNCGYAAARLPLTVTFAPS